MQRTTTTRTSSMAWMKHQGRCSYPRSYHPHHLSRSTLSQKTTSFRHATELAHRMDFRHLEQEQVRVGIVGAGAIAKATAALLTQAGHATTMLWSPSGASLPYDSDTTTMTATGAMDFEFSTKITQSGKQLVADNDVIVFALPANGHKKVFDELAPWFQSGQHIIISSHSSLGGLYLSQLLQKHNVHGVSITAWGTTPCTARSSKNVEERTTVNVNTIRQNVDTCTIPFKVQSQATTLCSRLFGDRIEFRPRDGLLAISLSNLNPQNHLGIALGNISRMEKGEAWYQFENVTPTIGRFLEQLDEERLNIAKALNLEVKTIFDHFSQGFHVPITDSISDMNQEIHKGGKDVYGPTSADSRYVTEDVPFGLTLVVAFGELTNRPAILHQSGLQILSAMCGRDFMNENDLLNALDLKRYDLADLQEAAFTGSLPANSLLISHSGKEDVHTMSGN
eukprot:scaffold599_cov94-Cylindrotheca_fusiformis.AAC.1